MKSLVRNLRALWPLTASTLVPFWRAKAQTAVASLARASERAFGKASLIMHESSPRRQGLGKGLEQR